jgi:hypothetical protein
MMRRAQPDACRARHGIAARAVRNRDHGCYFATTLPPAIFSHVPWGT